MIDVKKVIEAMDFHSMRSKAIPATVFRCGEVAQALRLLAAEVMAWRFSATPGLGLDQLEANAAVHTARDLTDMALDLTGLRETNT